jgi:hypothetical protein
MTSLNTIALPFSVAFASVSSAFCYLRGSQLSVVCRASCGESAVMLAAVSNGAVCVLLSEASKCTEGMNSSVENGECKACAVTRQTAINHIVHTREAGGECWRKLTF